MGHGLVVTATGRLLAGTGAWGILVQEHAPRGGGLAGGLLQSLQNALETGQFGALAGGGGQRPFLRLRPPSNALGGRATQGSW